MLIDIFTYYDNDKYILHGLTLKNIWRKRDEELL